MRALATPMKKTNQNPEIKAYTVHNFCKAHQISKAHFYRMLRVGKGPKIIRLGARTLISAEAAAAWRKRMETDIKPKVT